MFAGTRSNPLLVWASSVPGRARYAGCRVPQAIGQARGRTSALGGTFFERRHKHKQLPSRRNNPNSRRPHVMSSLCRKAFQFTQFVSRLCAIPGPLYLATGLVERGHSIPILLYNIQISLSSQDKFFPFLIAHHSLRIPARELLPPLPIHNQRRVSEPPNSSRHRPCTPLLSLAALSSPASQFFFWTLPTLLAYLYLDHHHIVLRSKSSHQHSLTHSFAHSFALSSTARSP